MIVGTACIEGIHSHESTNLCEAIYRQVADRCLVDYNPAGKAIGVEQYNTSQKGRVSSN